MTVMTAGGIDASPFVMSDERGNVLLMNAISNKWEEAFARSCVMHMGATGAIALYSATVRQLKQTAIPGTITLAEEIGKTLRQARLTETDPVDALRRSVGGFLVFRGKISDVDRRVVTGFARGGATMEGIADFEGKELLLEFQNEHLVVRIDGEFVATTPDLIAVVDSETARPITTEALRYGMRVAVIAIPLRAAMADAGGAGSRPPALFRLRCRLCACRGAVRVIHHRGTEGTELTPSK